MESADLESADLGSADLGSANTAGGASQGRGAGEAFSRAHHDRLANAIRALAMDAVEQANSGHPGLPMGAADVATVLFTQFLKFDPGDPHWPDRDRFVLSAGHGSMLLYALLYLLGYEKMTLADIKRFRQLGSLAAGHPEHDHPPGVETTTGPLGQGLGTAVGMALAERHLRAEFGDAIVDHHTFVLASDGDLMEGISQEAIAFAGHQRLSKLIVFHDDNRVSIDGPLSLADSVDQVRRFEACGWDATRIDGHDPEAVAAAIAWAKGNSRPTLIGCRTIIAYGAPTKAGTAKAHGSPLGAEEIRGARERLGWTSPPFEIPDDILSAWRAVGARGRPVRAAWEKRLADLAADRRAEFNRRTAGDLPEAALEGAVRGLKEDLDRAPKEIATRAASEFALGALITAVPEMVGGSADLTPSNNTRPKGMPEMTAAQPAGRFIHFGIREHGAAAAMNGMALHGGVIPYSGTFLIFSDYCRPAIRLAALMGERVIHVFTHDSIGLGEDGPTHQPVEHLAALRAIPRLLVLRPCDAVETVECWELALRNRDRPSALALSRQNLPQLRHGFVAANRCAAGAYELLGAEDGGEAEVSLFASGSEVQIAVAARKLLGAQGIAARVVSIPCFELFLAGDAAARAAVVGEAPVRVGIEAAVRQGWDEIIGRDGVFIGMTQFGASAPAKDLYRHFGITAERTVDAVRAALTQINAKI